MEAPELNRTEPNRIEAPLVETTEGFSGYFKKIFHAGKTVLDGMSVTFSHFLRKPQTIQYPEVPVTNDLPERYRGLLEVDMDICTACMACERACPINCIKIDMKKVEKSLIMSRFDIDMAKCMYCGLCSEPCPTAAIRHTREFEGATPILQSLIFRFVPPGESIIGYKPKKEDGDKMPDTREKGAIAREARALGYAFNPAWYATGLKLTVSAPKKKVDEKKEAAPKVDASSVAAKRGEFEKKLADKSEQKIFKLLREIVADTDCGECGYPTCDEYSQVMASGKEKDRSLCKPGGAETEAEINLVYMIIEGKPAGAKNEPTA